MPAFSTRYSTLPRLGLADGGRHVERDRADLGVRHQAARTEDAAELAHGAHHVGRRDHAVEVEEAFVDLGDQVVAAGEVGAGLAASLSFSPLAKTRTRTVLPGAVRQHDRAAHHLIGVLGIHAQADREVDRLVELGELGLLHQGARLLDAVLARWSTTARRPSRVSWRFSAFASLFRLSCLPPSLRRPSRSGGVQLRREARASSRVRSSASSRSPSSDVVRRRSRCPSSGRCP